ncbi:MAG: conjugal transfer protein TraX [Defluviitaleaceae bacterium]|nr:conjugal transfer protein TraX [Defluviitaleaceae bacterium]MCL2276143.1 conjugal transfer protein TraX [Defluviitaleaceae bacterium]
MSSFVIKIIAVISMLFDHTRVFFPDTFPMEFRVIGRIAFPLFVFLVAEGFHHTRSPIKFLLRLLAFALISEPIFDAAQPWDGWENINFLSHTNIFYTLFLGGASIAAYKYVQARWNVTSLAILPAVGFAALGHLLTADYGAMGVLFIFALYITKKTQPRLLLWVMAGMCLLLWHNVLWDLAMGVRYAAITYVMVGATVLAVPIAAAYNGKRGINTPWVKWGFYVFYPLHLAALGVIASLPHILK